MAPDTSAATAGRAGWRERFWARVLLSPDSSVIECTKEEARVPNGSGLTQVWGDYSEAQRTADVAPDLLVLRLLGARGRAELATQDPANRLSGVRSITWTVNPPGFGDSTGPLAIDHYLRGALAAYDFVATRYRGARIWVYGKSIGGTAAIYLAAQRVPDAVILKNPINVPAVAAHRVSRWLPKLVADRVCATIPRELDPVLWARTAKSRVLFVISRGDRLSLQGNQEEIARCYGGCVDVLHVAGTHDQPALSEEDEPRYSAALRAMWNRHDTSLADERPSTTGASS